MRRFLRVWNSQQELCFVLFCFFFLLFFFFGGGGRGDVSCWFGDFRSNPRDFLGVFCCYTG